MARLSPREGAWRRARGRAWSVAALVSGARGMGLDLDALLHHYFGTTALETLDDSAIELGMERLGTGFWTEREPGRRFALWVLLHSLGDAPDPETAFKTVREREAAHAYARAAFRAEQP